MFKTLRITGFIILLGILGCGGSGTSPSTNATAGNQSPIAVSDTYSVDSNTTLSVLVNDRDPDGTTLNLVSVTQPANGSVEITGSQISLTIDNDYVGNDQFIYTISDANGATATAQVQLALDPASKRPVAVNDKQSSIENTVISIDVLANDSDANADTLSIVAVGSPINGTAEIQSGLISYTPNLNFTGEDNFTYSITDGEFEATANITVLITNNSNSTNLSPLAVADTVAVSFETPQIIDVLFNDSDPESDVLTLVEVFSPDHGSTTIKTISRSGVNVTAVEYIPDNNYVGPDSFLYTITDGINTVASTVTVDVRTAAANLPPLAKDDFVNVTPGSTLAIAIFANDSDPDGDQLRLVSVDNTSGGIYSIDDNGTIDNIFDDILTYTPAPGFSGTAILVYTLSDGIAEDRAAINLYVDANPVPRVLITGTVHKGAVQNSLVTAHLFDRNGTDQLDLAFAAATSELDGSWVTELPTSNEEYMLTAQGGSFADESDPMVNAISQRVVSLSDQAILQSMWESGQSHVSINAYTSAFIGKARNESTNSFFATIKNNRVIATNAMGFDPFASKTADPINPQSGANVQELQYALYLGGFANVLNAHSIDQQLPLPTAELVIGSIEDLADCSIDGLTFDGPINVLTPRGNRVLTDITNLNPEIKRFKNNNFTLFEIEPPQFNINECLISGASTDNTAPVVSLNPTSNGELANVFLNVGDPYVEAGVSAIDNIDGDLSALVFISISDGTNILNAIDANIPGVYGITYTVTDDSGNSTSIDRTVTVRTPIVSIAGASLLEGDVGTSDLVFVISLDNVTNTDVTVTATTFDGTATQADSDFTATSQPITIPAGQLQANFTVSIIGDTVVESNETVLVKLSAPTNAQLDAVNFESTGEIINDDSTSLTITTATVLEGNSGTTNLPFMITLSELSAQDVSVDFVTVDGTATVADNDYVPLSGSVTTIVIPAGSSTLLINIPVKGDTKTETDETFSVVLSNAVNATLGNTSVTGIILNDDNPVISINNRSLAEGDTASVAFVFSVTLDQSSSQTISVDIAVADQTASLADNDYQAVAPISLTFLPGETLKTFLVNVNGDVAVENDETFIVNLSNPVNASLDLVSNQGVGTILNDDGVTISISDIVLIEGNAGSSNAVFDVNLSNPDTINTVSVDFATLDGSAVAGSDYLPQSGTLNFAPGITSASISVPVNGDLQVEDVEDFFIQLSNPVNAAISDNTGRGSINNDDLSIATIDSPSLNEGNSGQSNIVFTVTLDQVSTQTISIDYSTSDGSALTVNGDYIATAGSLAIAPGLTTGQISIPVVGDTTVENDESFTLNLLSASNAILAATSTNANILNDDQSEISVSDASIVEGTGGTTNIQFTLGLDQLSPVDIQVDVTTQDLSAIAGSDYTAISQTVTITANNLSTNVVIPINSDSIVEDDETFTVDLSNPVNAVVSPIAGSAIGTILDDDEPVLSINNVSVLEGDVINDLVFTVSLDQASNLDVSFTLTTSDGTASLVDNDYVGLPATIFTIPAGSTTLPIAVTVIDDVLVELDETLNITLSSPVNATLDPVTFSGVGQIVNDDGVTISIDDQTILEGNAGTQIVTFNVTLSNPNNINTVTVDYLTVDGTALAGEDYTANSGSLSFAPGETAKTITVTTNGDVKVESDEQFIVQLSNPTNSAISDGQGIGVISNDDSTALSITDVAQNEDLGDMIFTVSLDNPADSDVTVAYTTTNGTATTTNNDYTLKTGTLIFSPGVTSKTIAVPVTSDTTVESDEIFTVNLSAPTNATIFDGQGQGTIANDDATALSISDLIQSEDSGSMVFTVNLSNIADSAVTVNYTTTDGSATVADNDYTLTSGTLTFSTGVTSQTITVPVTTDSTVESDETFTVDLSVATVATIADGQGTGTITNDDATALSISDVSQAEDSGNLVFTVTLDNPSDSAVTVNYTTTDGSATVADSDYTLTSGTLTFIAGIISQTITVPVTTDSIVEGDETFTVDLSAPTVATIADGQGTGTITNDDATALSITDVSQAEDLGDMVFTVSLDNPADSAVTVNYTTTDGSATVADNDYTVTSGTLSFAAGITSKTITVPVTTDNTVESDEMFTVDLSAPTGATIADGQGLGTITNDDATALSITDISQAEDLGDMVFTVSLDNPADSALTVNYTTTNGSATVTDSDYTLSSGTVTFAAGVTSQAINVPVTTDSTVEGDETFTVDLSAPTVATIADGQGTGTITNDDATALSISDALAVLEGDSGTVNAVFTVSLDNPADSPVTVNYATTDGSATLTDNDYAFTSGTLTFAAGITSLSINVPVTGDVTVESDENFTLDLSAPTVATILSGTAIGTISNDDSTSLSITDVSLAEGDAGTTDFVFNVSLSKPADSTITVDFTTNDGTATTADSDYIIAAGSLSFLAGTSVQSITVTVNADVTVEPDEIFTVDLSNPNLATIFDGQGQGTILNDEQRLAIVNIVTGDEGGTAVNADFGINTDAGVLVFNPGVSTGSTTTYTSNVLAVTAGTFTLNANAVPGYVQTGLICNAGTLLGNMITVAVGEIVTCTYTFNDDATLDSDVDGLPDLFETTAGCPNVSIPDSDSDGLSDGIEVNYGLDPCTPYDPTKIISVSQAGPITTIPLPGDAAFPGGGSASEPVLVLIEEGTYADSRDLDIAGGNCNDLVYAGSFDSTTPGQLPNLDTDGRPKTIIDMQDTYFTHVQNCSGIRFFNLVLSNGIGFDSGGGDTRGGGIRFSGGTDAYMENVWVENNTATDQGGGIALSNNGTVLNATDLVVRNNSVTGISGNKGGGGIWLGDGTELNIFDSRIYNNSAASVGGGGIQLELGSTSLISNSVIANNTTTGTNGGGGILASDTGGGSEVVMTIRDSIITGNSASSFGGGVSIITGNNKVNVFNNLITGNHAQQGGGVFVSGTSEFGNNTLAYNQSVAEGAAYAVGSNIPPIADSIFWRNRDNNDTLAIVTNAGDTFDTATSPYSYSRFNLIESPEGNLDITSSDLLSTDPVFESAFYLDPSLSPAMNSGSDDADKVGLVDLSTRTSQTDGTLDALLADGGDGITANRGFHYISGQTGIADSIIIQSPGANALLAGAATSQEIVFIPAVDGVRLGDGQEVIVEVTNTNTTLPIDFLQAATTLRPNGVNLTTGVASVIASNIGDGEYVVTVDTSTVSAGFTIDLTFIVNDVPFTVVFNTIP